MAIARALVREPAVLFADEPTGSLDSATGESILDLLLAVSETGTAVVTITHDLHIASRMPRQVEMSDGRIVSDSAPGSAAMIRLSLGDQLRTALIGPRSRRMRTALSALGIAVGIAALTAISGISASNQQQLLADLDSLGGNLILVKPGVGPDQQPVPLPAYGGGHGQASG